MFLLLQLLSFIQYVAADLIYEPDIYYNTVDDDNMIATSLWAMGLCTCIGVVCKQKNKLPITITPEEMYDGETVIYAIEKKSGKSISELKEQLDEFKTIIDRLYIEQKKEEKEKKEKEKKDIGNWIEGPVRFMFGKGEIRYKHNDKYYHGITIHDKKKYNMKDYNHRFFERLDDKPQEHWVLGTTNPNEYCCNCSLDNENSKRRKVWNIYKCNGHTLSEFDN